MISILTDNANLLMQTNLNKATNRLDLIMARLSSGCRINSAKDDAAGLAIASSLESSIRGLNQASSNAQMGLNYLTIGSGALSTMTSIAQRLRDLSVQGANSTYSSSSRNAMQKEGDELVAELLRIKESTEFNGIKIFGSGTAVGGAENTNELDFASLPMMAMGEIDLAPASADSSGVTGDFIGTVNQITEENIPEGYTAIRTVEDLNNIRNNLSGNR